MGNEIPLWLVTTVIVTALCTGLLMLAVVIIKYGVHQWFHVVGGPMLSVLGVVLIGLTVFGNVKLKAGSFEAELSRLQAAIEQKEQQVADLNERLQIASSAFTGLSSAVDLASSRPAAAGYITDLQKAHKEAREKIDGILYRAMTGERERGG